MGFICYSLAVWFLDLGWGATCFSDSFIAKGRTSFVFEIKEWGRYAIQIENPECSRIELIDKKVGLRAKDGIVGERNGRIDAFLENGPYKINIFSHSEGKARAKITVTPFKDLQAKAPQYMVQTKSYRGELNDLQQISWWILHEKDGPIFLEAWGRNVSDLRLWREGEWLDPSLPTSGAYRLLNSNKVKTQRIFSKIPAGYYRVTVYGGAVTTWVKESNTHPFEAQWGLTKIPVCGITQQSLPLLQRQLFRVSGQNQHILLSLKKKARVYLRASEFSERRLRVQSERRDSIHNKSIDPRVLMNVSSYNRADHFVDIRGNQNQAYTLKSMPGFRSHIQINHPGRYWLSTIHSGNPDDQLGASGILVDESERDQHKVIRSKAVSITKAKPFIRRFNLLSAMTMYLHLPASGKFRFEFESDMVKAELRPIRIGSEAGNNWKPFYESKSFSLNKGYYHLQLSPSKKGIVNLSVKSASLSAKIKSAILGDNDKASATTPNIQLTDLVVSKKERFTLYINQLFPEITGIIFRKLPVNLDTRVACLGNQFQAHYNSNHGKSSFSINY